MRGVRAETGGTWYAWAAVTAGCGSCVLSTFDDYATMSSQIVAMSGVGRS
jgi:hypothetical protein